MTALTSVRKPVSTQPLASPFQSTKSKAAMQKAKRHDETQWRNLICDELKLRVIHGVKMVEMSKDTGLSVTTISNLVYGITRFPRFETIVALMRYLGYRLYAER